MFYKTVWKQCRENHDKIDKVRAVGHNLVIQLSL